MRTGLKGPILQPPEEGAPLHLSPGEKGKMSCSLKYSVEEGLMDTMDCPKDVGFETY